ncbi:MAG TPA: thymidylate kinase [Candidatus Angelobacter sp.]|jgi:thymidylate kinase|nr:thymidylate kinase [Candidatus Angelobacter sp.]
MANQHRSRPLLISFSGVDGSGKSTQIENLRSALESAGLRTQLVTFWDDVVVGVKYREGFVHRVYKSERGIGTPGKPVNRRDKNMRGWYLTLARHFLYFLDAVNLRRIIRREMRYRRADVIICDRYIYDELSNLKLENTLSRRFVRLIARLVPLPDIAYLLDADPVAAYARKPEYPVEFMKKCRRSYYELAGILGTMTLVPALDLPDAKIAVLKTAERVLRNAGHDRDLIQGGMQVA